MSINSIVDQIATDDVERFKAIKRKQLKEEVKTMSPTEARFLVDSYYIAQRERIRFDNQVRSMERTEEPTLVLGFMSNQSQRREELLKKALDEYTKFHPVGQWMRTINGIGPVTAAGLLAHIDINKAATAGAIWKFAGISGVEVWEKGQIRPWNAHLKTLCYKIGESFVKVSGNENAYYGQLYKNRKLKETELNLSGAYAEKAAAELASKNYSDGTVTKTALLAGRLSDGHIHARARRYAVKIFLSHLHHVMYVTLLGKQPPMPFALAILNHAHYLEVPNRESIVDFVEPIEIPYNNDFEAGYTE